MQPWCYYGGYVGGVTYQSQYGPASGNLIGIWDWGANSIRNPKTGKDETNWRTPTKAEWECLIESTSKYGYARFVDTRYIDASGQSRVRYLSGIVLIPTGFVDPMCAQSDENTSVYNRRFKTSAEFTQEGIYTQNIYKYDGTPANARVENSGRSAGNGVRLVRTVTE